MARVNITVPDDIAASAREARLDISRVATAALADELDRLAKIRALDEYLAELDAEFGPLSAEEIAEGEQWADRVFGQQAKSGRCMTLLLDSGGVSALADQRIQLNALVRRNDWPPQVPAVVLTEALTGDHRRDFHTNKLLGMCQVRAVTESHARAGASLRGRVARPSGVSERMAHEYCPSDTYVPCVLR